MDHFSEKVDHFFKKCTTFRKKWTTFSKSGPLFEKVDHFSEKVDHFFWYRHGDLNVRDNIARDNPDYAGFYASIMGRCPVVLALVRCVLEDRPESPAFFFLTEIAHYRIII